MVSIDTFEYNIDPYYSYIYIDMYLHITLILPYQQLSIDNPIYSFNYIIFDPLLYHSIYLWLHIDPYIISTINH